MKHAKRWYSAQRGRLVRLAWAVVEGAIGAGVGLLFVILYLRGC